VRGSEAAWISLHPLGFSAQPRRFQGRGAGPHVVHGACVVGGVINCSLVVAVLAVVSGARFRKQRLQRPRLLPQRGCWTGATGIGCVEQ